MEGAEIYYAEEKRRVEVLLNPEIYQQCLEHIHAARELAKNGVCPDPLVDDPRCLYCSAYPVCLPNESRFWKKNEEPQDQKIAPPRPPGDDTEILLVQNPKAKVGKRGDKFVLTVEGETMATLPIQQTRAVYLYGNPQISTQILHTCMENEIEVAYFSATGRFIGCTSGLPTSGTEARRGQYRLFEEDGIRLKLAGEIVRAKIHNQRVLLMRNGSASKVDLKELEIQRNRTNSAKSMAELLGIEGAAAAIYFKNFSTVIP